MLIRTAIIACLLISPVMAENGPDCGFYQYEANVVSVYDGDTLRADVDLGFNTWRMNEPFRLYGIDTPELRGVDATTKAKGIAARNALRKRILNQDIVLCSIKDKAGKYGRYLAVIWLGGENINDWLIKEGHAIPYE